MALVVLCGYPASGKSKRAKEILDYVTNQHPTYKCVIVSDHGIDRNAVYGNSRSEITTRGALKSATERELTSKTIVIVDSLNYIKGFRYELHCVSKYARTTYCVIHCVASKDDIIEYNSQKNESDRYSNDILEALLMRFECPDPNNRWDSPLFTILSTEKLPLNDICQAIFQKTAQKPNMSTQNPPLMSPTFVFEVDKMLQKICSTICAAQKTTSIGETVHFPETGDAYIMKKNISMPEMRRIRKQFLTFLRANPVSEMSQVPKTFLSFMDQSVV